MAFNDADIKQLRDQQSITSDWMYEATKILDRIHHFTDTWNAEQLKTLVNSLNPEKFTFGSIPPVPSTSLTGSWGIDVSSHQGVVDWDAVAAAGCRFAFIKATEGTGYVNPGFGRDWAEAKRVGLARGAYHFARPGIPVTAEAQAAFFWNTVGAVDDGDFLVLDMEAGDGNLADWTIAWMHLVQAHYANAQRVLLYSGLWFMSPHGLLHPTLARYPLWLAAYQDHAPEPPEPWTEIAFWQDADDGRVNGIATTVDLNRCLKDPR